ALARFASLELRGQQISDAGVRALAESPHARALTTLNLRDNRISDEGVSALAWSPHLASLTCLDVSAGLGMGQVSLVGVRRIAESAYLRDLVTLRLTTTPNTSDSCAEPLLEPGRLPNLRDLVLNVARTEQLVERFRARGVELTTFYAGD